MTLWGNSSNKSLLQILLLALLLSLTAGAAWAQDDAAGDEADTTEEEDESADLGRITVTGSLLRREEFTSTSPMQIINAETQAQVGQLSAAQILQNSTVAAGTTQINNQFNGFVVQGGTGVQTLDLRGLGPNRTLLLLNGRRPGGSGTRGEVQAFDLTNIPEIAAQRFEIVLDGSSSIYGSDAVAGVANVITRRSIDGFEAQAITEVPFDSGGERYRVGAIFGKIFEKGAFTVSAQWELNQALTVGDRDFLSCAEDIAYGTNGQRIDREDRSVIGDTALGGCGNLYANTVIDLFTGARYIPSPDGVTDGPFPGYRPRNNGRYDDAGGQAYYEDVLNFDFVGSDMARNRLERVNVYATADYSFDFWGGVDWDADFLYSSRKTNAKGWRQFFPLISSPDYIPYPNDPTYDPGVGLSYPVMPYISNSEIEVDYYYFTTGLEGVLPTKNYWSWQVYGSYSRSSGDYTGESILASVSGDIRFDDSPPRVDYFSPAILSGQNMQAVIDAVGVVHTGNTVYDQWQTVGILSGDLFELPAGTVGAAFGVEYRHFSIDDQPSQESQSGDLWGQSSALVTKGSNNVWEGFMEAEIPLLAGMTAVEELTLNVSARVFDYDVGGSDWVWKAGMKWAITPEFMLRGTAGTSYRAPALFELFLGDQTAFLSQLSIDPCIDWGESNNSNLRTNCAAEGIPEDYTGGGSSATIISGGGAENLEPETSDAYTAGFVWTPQFADLSIAVDYFDIKVQDQIAQLGASSILGGCYTGDNYPNAFCDLFTRAPGDAPGFPYAILEVRDSYLNVNEQRVKGVDMNLRYDHDFSFGSFVLENQTTWYSENVQQLFDPALVSGFDTTDYVGTVGNPDLVSNLRASLNRDDWTFTYYFQYVGETDDSLFVDETGSYFGYEDARFDITMGAAFFQNLSVFYQQDKWDLLVGINNIFDKQPGVVSDVYRSRRGNVPIAATQYDLLGRRLFARVNVRF